MKVAVLSILSLVLVFAQAKVKLDHRLDQQLLRHGRPQIGLWQALLEEQKAVEQTSHHAQHLFSADEPSYEAHCFTQLKTHFDDSDNSTFCQRYWIDASNYRPGGPVFVLDGGETDGAGRLPYLEKGILQILANATNGISIVLEHRYYGESVPVESFTTDNLRWLNNEEALEDSAYFIEHFKMPKTVLELDDSILELDDSILKADKTPWMYYGGSYAGARAAHMRVQYPHLVWGAIASSGKCPVPTPSLL